MLKKANQLYQMEKYRQAIDEYDKILLQNPKNLQALYNKALSYDSLRDYLQAAATYQQIIETDPQFKGGDVYYEQGQLYQLARLNQQSRRAYKKYISLKPNHPECHFNLGQVLQELNQQQEALKCYDEATDYKKDYSKAYKAKISLLKKLKKYPQIISTCGKALLYQPTDFQIYYEQGLAYYHMNNYKEAIDSFKQTLQYNGRSIRASIYLADCYNQLIQDKQALAVYERCLHDNQAYLTSQQKKQIHLNLGIILMNLKDFKGAIESFRFVLSQRPIIPHVKVKLTRCLEQYGNYFFKNKSYSQALNYYDQALKIDKSRVSLINNSGLAYQNINNYAEAQRCFNKALQLQPNNPKALNNLAGLYSATGKHDKAAKLFDEAAKQDPNDYKCIVNRGKFNMSENKFKEAYEEFVKAQKIKPDEPNLLNDMAVALEKMGKLEEALQYANRANQITKYRSPLLLINRADLLIGLKRITEARKDFDKAAQELRSPDKSNLAKMGLNADNLRYMFTQLDHYAYLMSPIDVFRENLAHENENEIGSPSQQQQLPYQQTLAKAQQMVLSRVMQNIKGQNGQGNINTQKSRIMRGQVQKMVKLADEQRRQIKKLKHQIIQLNQQVQIVKKQSHQMKETFFKYLPQSINLRKRFDELQENKQIFFWQYGKQLYWILNTYLTSYMLISTGIVGKGQNINRSIFSKALGAIQSLADFMKNVPIVGDFSDLISKVCGIFVDMEDQAIIKKMYQLISLNYNTMEQLNDAICQAILLFLNDCSKIDKIKQNVMLDKKKGFLKSLNEGIDEICSWFEDKKNDFIIHMRGYGKIENVAQTELAVIDVGIIVSIMLKMECSPNVRKPVITNAAKKALKDGQVESMVCEAYDRENNNLRVSSNGFCEVMRCSIVYDNLLLNDQSFMSFVSSRSNPQNKLLTNILNHSINIDKNILGLLLSMGYYRQIIQLILTSKYEMIQNQIE